MEIKIPIEIVELEDNSFHIIVSLQIGSIEGDFIIDTGASVTVIDKLTPGLVMNRWMMFPRLTPGCVRRN